MQKTVEVIDWIRPLLPADKTRYTMGVGLNPQDLIDVVARGVDIFDCVAPTRNARHGSLYCGRLVEENNWLRFEPEAPEQQGKILIKKAVYATDEKPSWKLAPAILVDILRVLIYTSYLNNKRWHIITWLVFTNIHVMQMVCSKMQDIIRNGIHDWYPLIGKLIWKQFAHYYRFFIRRVNRLGA